MYGNVLVLDSILQCTEKDEFAYHEMISHVPLFAHPSPKTVSTVVSHINYFINVFVQVLIVGGGDGGTLREVAKHPEVEEIHLCEIDEVLITFIEVIMTTLFHFKTFRRL